jgi:hypothetical protein
MARHPLHSICPYFAMFPEGFVERHVLASTRPGDVVFDPFCGRGTTVFQSLLMNRQAAGMDINPVAACVAGSKADPPRLLEVLERIDELEQSFARRRKVRDAPNIFFSHCFHRLTLQQLLFLRERLDWTSDKVDRFVAALSLGALHGESHKSPLYLSNRMPRTISTKPEYSIRWWRERGLRPPIRDVFSVLRQLARFRFKTEPASIVGSIRMGDSRRAKSHFKKLTGAVNLIVTSPPYLDVTDYAEDQWLRLWFLGGAPVPTRRRFADDRLTSRENYWAFLAEVWGGISSLLAPQSRVVVRIGGRIPVGELATGLKCSLVRGMPDRHVKMAATPFTSEVKGRQTNNFRPGAAASVEHDFVFSIR